MEKSQTIAEISTTCKENFKIVISPELEHKIRTYCALSPQREWSGVLFYKFEGNFTNGVTILANDFYLMDQGTHVHTEFDLNDTEVARYMVFNNLTDHCMGLLHSHCSFNAFFSGEDNGTLLQYGKEMNNFVSLVVSNAGPYVARLTRKTTFKGEQKTIIEGVHETILFNTDTRESVRSSKQSSKHIEESTIQYIDLNIVMPEHTFDNDVIERFGEINTKCSQEKVSKSKIGSWDFNGYKKGTTFPEVPSKPFYQDWNWKSKPEVYKRSEEVVKQGKLFEDDDLEFPNTTLMAWEEHGFKVWFATLMQGNLFRVSQYWSVKDIESSYDKAFNDIEDFREWFNWWIDYMVGRYDLKWVTDENFVPDELLLYKTLESIQNLASFKYADEMCTIIEERLM